MGNSGSSLNAYLSGAQIRARRRKSPWNLLLLVFAVLGIGFVWILTVRLLAEYRESLALPDSFLTGGTRFGNILMHVCPGFPSIVLGLILANLLTWCIPTARTALAGEAQGFPGTDFRSSNIALGKGFVFLAVVTLPFALLGARNMWSVTSQTLRYRPLFSSSARNFSWSDLRAIHTGCHLGRTLDRNFVLEFRDGSSMDLSEERPREFLSAYPLIQAALAGREYQFNRESAVGGCLDVLSPVWKRILTERPTSPSP